MFVLGQKLNVAAVLLVIAVSWCPLLAREIPIQLGDARATALIISPEVEMKALSPGDDFVLDVQRMYRDYLKAYDKESFVSGSYKNTDILLSLPEIRDENNNPKKLVSSISVCLAISAHTPSIMSTIRMSV